MEGKVLEREKNPGEDLVKNSGNRTVLRGCMQRCYFLDHNSQDAVESLVVKS